MRRNCSQSLLYVYIPLTFHHDVSPPTTCDPQEQPVSATFEKIWEAAALFGHWTQSHRDAVTDGDQWGLHAVQAVAWENLGTLICQYRLSS